MRLPRPKTDGSVSVEAAIAARRSVRSYEPGPLSLEQVSQLLWAAQGNTGPGDLRAAPSAGATYPLTIYVVAGEVEGAEAGLYRYETGSHELTLMKSGDFRAELSQLALEQSAVKDAAVVLVFAADYSRTTQRYGDRGMMYVHFDAGHAAENVLLQGTALGLGSVPVGAFRTRSIGAALGIGEGEVVLYLIPVGRA